MIYCFECGRVVSENDNVCPGCGKSLKTGMGHGFGDRGDRPAESRTPYQVLMCNYCHGTGISPGDDLVAEKCPVCKGNGGVKVKTPYLSCMSCNGTGRRSDITGFGICPECRGTGWISRL